MNNYFGKTNSNERSIIQALENTNVSLFMYYPKERKAIFSKNLCEQFQCETVYESMPESFAEKYILVDEKKSFIEMFEKIQIGKKIFSAQFHINNRNSLLEVTLTALAHDENGKAGAVIGVINDVIDNDSTNSNETAEILEVIASSISKQYYAIYHVWVDSNTYICFEENRDGVLSVIGEKGDYDAALNFYIDHYVVKEDQEKMKLFTNLSNVKQRLKDRNSIYQTYKQKEIGWTRGTFIAGKRDKDGNVTNVIYSVANINDEVEQEIKQKQIAYKATHDALTGLYNRHGFESCLTTDSSISKNIGILVLDIDYFKTINDTFGHIIGDQVLQDVAKQLKAISYQEDIIARVGGDEFAILLQNCDVSIWNKICTKLQMVHMALANSYSQYSELSITLSAGLVFTNAGYSKELIKIADAGLYETKRLGRAGCTLMSAEYNILHHWKDETLSLLAKNILEYNSTGICQIEIPDDPNQPRCLICGNAEKLLLGIPKTATPEECYKIWHDRIDSAYIEALMRTEKSMIEKGQTECTFLWQHPDYGKIYLRCGGIGERKNGKTILAGYCHPLTNTNIVTKQDDQELILRTLNDSFVASYYIDFEKDSVSSFKVSLAADYIPSDATNITDLLNYFLNNAVDPRDRELMRQFSNLNTLQERLHKMNHLDAEYRSMLVGTWCRARLIPVRFNQKGLPSHILLTITALDSNNNMEVYALDYNRRSLASLFDNLHCGIVMYEYKEGVVNVVHMSKYYEDHYSHRFVKLDENNQYHSDNSCIHPEDIEGHQKAINIAINKTGELHNEYRVWDDKFGGYIWEKADILFSKQIDGSYMIYAVYTDITQRKEQEMTLQKSHVSLVTALDASNQLCYEYDPILHTLVCMTEERHFEIPQCLDDYPECLRNYDLIHPDDIERFIEITHQVEKGTETAQCDVRFKTHGKYIWYSCTFNEYSDLEKEHRVVILSIVDISLRVATEKMYEERLKSLETNTENTLGVFLINVSKETFETVSIKDSAKALVDISLSLKDCLHKAMSFVIGETNQKKFAEMFDVNYLQQQASKGIRHLEIESLMKLTEHHYEWILTTIDLMQNLFTGEIFGAVDIKSIQKEKLNQMLLQKAVRQDYVIAFIVTVDTDEFYVYNAQTGAYSICKQNYWKAVLENVRQYCPNEAEKELHQIFVKQKILDHLEDHPDYRYVYDGVVNQQPARVEIKFSYLDDSHATLVVSVRNIIDITLMERYRHDSRHDELTDLYNRRTMFNKCQELLKAYPHKQFAMLHIDIKQFRLFNTFFGDKAGDKLLCKLANRIRIFGDSLDCCAYGRIEADVFAAFFPYDKEVYNHFIEETIKDMNKYSSDFLVEISAGLYFVTNQDITSEAMFTRATLAAKLVRSETPYATVIFDEIMEKELKRNQEFLNEMQTAISQEQFKVYLQPKYSLRTDEPVGAEALVRWHHPTKGIILPGSFIPTFEKNGFITTFDRYMWEHTCQLLSKWKKMGQPLLPISVNVSRISAYSQDLVSFLKSLVQKYDIEPRYLELELTESAYVESSTDIRSRLLELQNFGFKILMDDFGSGYSSLNSLKELPFDILKLDMMFLSYGNDERGKKILSSVIRMSKLLDIPIIMEGVETENQAMYLRSIGCEYVQGELYSGPIPIEEYESKVVNSKSNKRTKEIMKVQHSVALDILLTDNSIARVLDEGIRWPIGLIEYNNQSIRCLRVNEAFLDEFGLKYDLRSVGLLIQEHLSEHDYNRMLRAFQRGVETQKTVLFQIIWEKDNGISVAYLAKITYEGSIGNEHEFIIELMNNEKLEFFE